MSSPYGTNPLFQYGSSSTFTGDATKPIAPIATLLPASAKEEKNPALIAGFRLTPSSGKSRFSLGASSPLTGSPLAKSKRDVLGLTPTKVGTPNSTGNLELTPEAFVIPRKGLKSLEISRTKRDLGIGEVRGIEAGESSRGTIDSRLERQARERERQDRTPGSIKLEAEKPSSANGPVTKDMPVPATKENIPPPKHTPTASTASTSTAPPAADPDLQSQDEGAYWTIPSMHAILSSPSVHSLPNFVVGRKGYGQVRFLAPVDLTAIRSIPDIPGQIVVFDRKICTVYPDEAAKPPVGRGLNVPAVITLEKCWPVSKESRAPIVDVENPRFVAHVERLKRQAETEFLDYIADSGSWVFKVSHF
jgi:nuclear pore complex protein Nup98-Nup96